MNPCRRKRRLGVRESGQGFIELLLVLPVLLLIIAAMVEVGWWLHDFVTISRAAREAARFGSRGIHVESLDIASVASQAMEESLRAQFDLPDPNAAIIVTEVDIEDDGTYTVFDTLTQGELAVSSRVCRTAGCPAGTTLDLNEIGLQNSEFNSSAELCPSAQECFNDLVIVDPF